MPGLGLSLRLGRTRSAASSGGNLLLDQYPGAIAAYSLRYLNSNFTGDVILAVRDSDNAELGFTPSEITNGTLDSWAGSATVYVKTWYDQSGNGVNQVQNTTSLQPRIAITGTLQEDGGLPTLNFAADYLSVTNANIITGNSPYTTILLINAIAVSATQRMYSINPEGNGAVSGKQTLFTTEYANRVSGNAIYNNAASLSRELATVIYPGTTIDQHNLWVDSVESGLKSSSAGISPMNIQNGSFNVGGDSGGNFTGLMQEAIFYDTDQSSNRAAIEALINEYYSVF